MKPKNMQQRIALALESLYGPCNHDKYLLVKDRSEEEVRQEILDKFKEDGIKSSLIDIFVVTSQINDDVFIRV